MRFDPQLGRRSLILFELPHLGTGQYIEMYLNPQNIQFSSRKHITETRTKGGFMIQYWGEDLDTINIQGTTGASGIEGINVLRDVYRSEQLALLELVAQNNADKRRQSLAQLAASVIMWYQDCGYKGYFTDMSYTENTQRLGLFDYTMNMKVTGIMGQRLNFMPWHRTPWSTSNMPMNNSRFASTIREGNLTRPPIRVVATTTKEDRKKYGPFKTEVIPYDPKKQLIK